MRCNYFIRLFLSFVESLTSITGETKIISPSEAFLKDDINVLVSLTRNTKVYILNIYNMKAAIQLYITYAMAWNSHNSKEIHMDIIISNSSGVPIYEQIEEQIKSQILSGELIEGDALPSMRVLAKELKISIITTKRAYEDLERDGFIESITGKGSFVKGINSDIVRENMLFSIQELLEKAVDKAILCNVSHEELNEMLALLYEEKSGR